ncbi:hypothetical protein [Streptosporangium sp. NPDC048865]|uniref:hypothetical protein n=1 Tax=Streptosporangium sp. NPDC048865 TaxID=3155766 RepID=UPI00341DD596
MQPISKSASSFLGQRKHRWLIIFCIFATFVALAVIAVLNHAHDSNCYRLSAAESDRARLVFVNSFSIANPDYQVNFADFGTAPLARQNDFGTCQNEIGFPVEARTPYSVSSGKAWEAKIVLKYDGSLEVPRVRDWTLGLLSRRVGHSSPELRRKTSEVHDIAERMGDDVEVQAMVSLKKPITEMQAKDLLPDTTGYFDLIFLSPGDIRSKPVTWDFTPCEHRKISNCGKGQSLIDAFRRWVSLLEDRDSTALAEFGLQLADLRAHADEGNVYGFIVSGKAGDVKSLFARSEVEWAQIVNLQMSPHFSGS